MRAFLLGRMPDIVVLDEDFKQDSRNLFEIDLLNRSF